MEKLCRPFLLDFRRKRTFQDPVPLGKLTVRSSFCNSSVQWRNFRATDVNKLQLFLATRTVVLHDSSNNLPIFPRCRNSRIKLGKHEDRVPLPAT